MTPNWYTRLLAKAETTWKTTAIAFKIFIAFIMIPIMGVVGGVGLGVYQHFESNWGVGTVSIFEGGGFLRSLTGQDYGRLQSGGKVLAQQVVASEPKSKLLLSLPDSSEIRIDSSTQLLIDTVIKRVPQQVWTQRAAVISGKAWVKAAHDGVEVKAPSGMLIKSNNAEFLLTVSLQGENSTEVVSVWDGFVNVTYNAQTVIVSKGQQTTLSNTGSSDTSSIGVATSPVPSPSASVAISGPVLGDVRDISDGVSSEPFTLFNLARDIPESKTDLLTGGSMEAASSSAVLPAFKANSSDDLKIAVFWHGKSIRLNALMPDGNTFTSFTATSSPMQVTLNEARSGNWKYSLDNTGDSNIDFWSTSWLKSPSSGPVPPLFKDASCSHTVTAGSSDVWKINAIAAYGPPAMTAGGLPHYATFTPSDDGSGKVDFHPESSQIPGIWSFSLLASLHGKQTQVWCLETIKPSPTDSRFYGGIYPAGGGLKVVLEPSEITTTSDAYGNFSFDNLKAGNYTVYVSPPAGFLFPEGVSAHLDGTEKYYASIVLHKIVPDPNNTSILPSPTPTPSPTLPPCKPSPSPSPTPMPSPSPSPSPSPTPTPSPSPSPTPSASPSPSPSPSLTPIPSPTPPCVVHG